MSTPTISADTVKDLRERTGAGFMDCKRALEETDGDLERAIVLLRERNQASAAKKAGREAREGVVASYIHTGGRIGALVEVNCETDFVARTDEFQALARNLAMHIAAEQPRWVRAEEIPAELLEQEKEVYRSLAIKEGRPEKVLDKIVEGRLKKFYGEVCLVDQPYVRDDQKTVADVIKEEMARLGENIAVRRFVRYQLGDEA